MVSHTMENMQFGDLHVGTDFSCETALIDRALTPLEPAPALET